MTDSLIAVVDDDDGVRSSTARLLELEGYRAHSFADGLQFLSAPEQSVFACVLLDMRMPGLDGMAVLERLAMQENAPTVIVVTGHGDVPAAVAAMRLGAFDFLEKPYDPDRLIEIVEAALAHQAGRASAHAEADRARGLVGSLSPRQHAVLEGLVEGLPNKLIAHRLDLSPRTVEMHRTALMEKLGVRSLSEAVRIAVSAGVGTEAPD
jgi:two-component system, LuxR family, response regulator FixJ